MTEIFMKLRALCLVSVCAVAAAGCGESHSGDEDAAIIFDATFPDAGVDAGPPPSNVGSPCAGDMDCAEPAAVCLSDISGLPLPEGYCSAYCAADDECPMGSTCVMFRGGSGGVCLLDCDLTIEDACPDTLGCIDAMGAPPVCLPGCDVDADCADGLTCNPMGGFIGEGNCYDAEGQLDSGCASDADCPAGAGCLDDDPNFPDGVCLVGGCDPATNTGCPGDSQCLDFGFSGDYCMDGCTADADCREAYECDEVQGRLTCQPSFVDANLGQTCNTATQGCPGGVCITEAGSGFPANYCAAVECDPADGTGCPGDGVCIEANDGSGICLDGCATATDCRDAYDCRPSDAEDPTSATACLPGCTSDAQCTYEPPRWRPGPAYVCNTGTGRCQTPFVEANLGEPCANAEDDCPGGACFTEADDGWPAGTCTYPGCRLSGTGPEATCPTGSVCTDDGAGDPELGVCVDACTVAATPSDCRPGYACVELTVGSTDGACRPMCTADGDCDTTSGRTCNLTTGLCE